MNPDDLRFAMEDARTHHQALLDLIYLNDQQSMSLLGHYLTVAVASAAVSLATATDGPLVETPVALGLTVAAVVLVLGALACFMAMQTALVPLTGEAASWWRWVARQNQDFAETAERYLARQESVAVELGKVNASAAWWLRLGRFLGPIAPVAALAAGAISSAI